MNCESNINEKDNVDEIMDMFQTLTDGLKTRAIAMKVATAAGSISPAAAQLAMGIISEIEDFFTTNTVTNVELKRLKILAKNSDKKKKMLESCYQKKIFLEKIVKTPLLTKLPTLEKFTPNVPSLNI